MEMKTAVLILEVLEDVIPNLVIGEHSRFSLINPSVLDFQLMKVKIFKRIGVSIRESWIQRDTTVTDLATIINAKRG